MEQRLTRLTGSVRPSHGRLSGSPSAGFTLLEVLIAVAIVVPAVTLLFLAGSECFTAVQTANRYENAILRARSRLAALTDTTLEPGERAGDDGEGFAWRTVIVALASTPPPASPPRNSPYANGTSLYEITVELSWPAGLSRRTLSLASRRLGPSRRNAP